MSIAQAQRDVRQMYAGGFYGQLVSGAIWLAAAAAETWISGPAAVATLFIGGILIFPLTTLIIRASGKPASLPSGHPMNALAAQIAFTVPLGLVVVVAMLGNRIELFFPASMVIVGAHYLPFVFLYGMRSFALLSGILVTVGLALLFWSPLPPNFAAWFSGALLVLFAILLRIFARSRDTTPAS